VATFGKVQLTLCEQLLLLADKVCALLRLDVDTGHSYKGMNWTIQVKSMLRSPEMIHVWNDQECIQPPCCALKLRMHDTYKHKWFADVSSAGKLNSSSLFNQVHQCEFYLS
jgi:hypothetical protein